MATGTGKTWVMQALLIWQYLNAKYEEKKSGRYTKNFLLIAPGIIVYERLLDAYLGKENIENEREFEASDIYRFRETFIPPSYREDVIGFVQSAVSRKKEIGTKVTGDGLIAIANWHLFMSEEDEVDIPSDDPSDIIKNIFPVRPGLSGGNSLGVLDSQYFSGGEISYLANLSDLMVMNDEAHHIHETKSYGDIKEVEWQKSLNTIAKIKGERFIQIDFSATPYDVTGSGHNRTKHYFPHIIVDFDLKAAIRGGLVKLIAMDKRKELIDQPLEYNAVRENGVVVGLSDGQKIMLRAGLSKLRILEKHFIEFTKDMFGTSSKHPKMLVMCEDTNVSPKVEEFLKEEGLSDREIMRIDSNRKGEVTEEEWKEIKTKLFNLDKNDHPKVIVSVLMLREGFDVNNICVIVPLRSSEAPILLEQTVGRGLRLMWREPEFEEVKLENRQKVLAEKCEPSNYLDLLSIVEHPAFQRFYDDLIEETFEITHDPEGKNGVLGDIIRVGLKPNYEKYDLFWPIIIKNTEEELVESEIKIDDLNPFVNYSLSTLKKFFTDDGEKFISEEMTVKTRFGEYVVDAALFKSQSYNEYLQKIVNSIVNRMIRVGQKNKKALPIIQINNVAVAAAIDSYIRTCLFEQEFDPFSDNNWKVLLLKNGVVTNHIIREISKVIFEMQQSIKPIEAEVEKRYFSEISELRMRENYSINITKTIYEKLPYPSNKGGFEKEFMLYADEDSDVDAIIKVNEFYHSFAAVSYIRTDGMLSFYYPDFIVKTSINIYIIETKSDKDLNDLNVRQKQFATLDLIKRINELPSKERGERDWSYVLIGENNFYSLKENSASINEICKLSEMTDMTVKGKLI
jgi:type III restriction enzyme